jgi:hypothetical protein
MIKLCSIHKSKTFLKPFSQASQAVSLCIQVTLHGGIPHGTSGLWIVDLLSLDKITTTWNEAHEPVQIRTDFIPCVPFPSKWSVVLSSSNSVLACQCLCIRASTIPSAGNETCSNWSWGNMRKHELSHEATHFIRRLFGACNGINQDFAERGPGGWESAWLGVLATKRTTLNRKEKIILLTRITKMKKTLSN